MNANDGLMLADRYYYDQSYAHQHDPFHRLRSDLGNGNKYFANSRENLLQTVSIVAVTVKRPARSLRNEIFTRRDLRLSSKVFTGTAVHIMRMGHLGLSRIYGLQITAFDTLNLNCSRPRGG